MPLTDPVPSSSFDVLERNVQDTDKFVNQETGTFTNRVGKVIKPISVIESEANAAIISLGWSPVGEFATGFTYTKLNDVGRDASGSWWRYNGSDLPKVITAGTVPSSPNFSVISFETADNVEWEGGKSVGYSLDDLQGFTDELLAQAGIADSGLPDTLGNSQRADAINIIAQSIADESAAEFNMVKYPKCADYKGRLGYKDGAFGIECWGDSTMWGSVSNNASVQEAKNPAAVLDLVLYGIYRGNNPTVVNRAIPGTTLKQMITGTNGYPTTFDAAMAASSASIIYSNHAHNDCFSGESTPVEFKDNLIIFVNICRKYNKVPVLVTPNVVNYDTVSGGITTVRYGAYVQQIRDVARAMDVDLVDIYKYTSNTTRSVSLLEIVPDGAHPSARGYQYIGATLALPLITPVMISAVGDGGGIVNTTYFDNITNDRIFSDTSGKFGRVLSGTIDATVQRVNIPVLLEHPTDDSVLTIVHDSSTAGGTVQYLHNDQFLDGFSGNLDFSAVTTVRDSFNAGTCDLWAGISIVGLIASSSLIPSSAGKNFNISGIQLFSRSSNIIQNPWHSAGAFVERPVIVGDTLNFVARVNASAAIETLAQLTTVAGNVPWLTIKNELGTVTAVTPNSSTIIGVASSEIYAAKIEILNSLAIRVTVGGLVAQLPDLAASVPNSYLDILTSKSDNFIVIR